MRLREAFEAVQLKPGDERKPIVKRILRVMERADRRQAAAKAKRKRGGK